MTTTSKTTSRATTQHDDDVVEIPVVAAPGLRNVKHDDLGMGGLVPIVLRLDCGHFLSGAVMGQEELLCLALACAVFAGIKTEQEITDTLRLAQVSGVPFEVATLDDVRAVIKRIAVALQQAQEGCTQAALSDAVRILFGQSSRSRD